MYSASNLNVAQGVGKAHGIDADFALVYRGFLVADDVFNRVFQRQNVARLGALRQYGERFFACQASTGKHRQATQHQRVT